MRCPTPDDCNEDGVCHGLCGDARTHTDLKALDAHVVTPEEYEDIPEWTDEEIARAERTPGLGWTLSQETLDLLAEIDKSIIRWPR